VLFPFCAWLVILLKYVMLSLVFVLALASPACGNECVDRDCREEAALLQVRKKQAHLEAKQEDDQGRCDVFGAKGKPLSKIIQNKSQLCNASERSQLPVVDARAIFNVSYVVGPLGFLEKLFSDESKPAADALHWLVPGLFHADLLFEGPDDVSFSIGWFMASSAFPGPLGLLMGGRGIVSWTPTPCSEPKNEPKNYLRKYTKTAIGSVQGTELNNWMEFVVQYGKSWPHYTIFSLANQGSVGKDFDDWVGSNECGDFAAKGIEQLYTLGAKLDEKVLVCKPYFSLQAQNPPVPVSSLSVKDPPIPVTDAWQTQNDSSPSDLDFDHKSYQSRFHAFFGLHPKSLFSVEDGSGAHWSFWPKFPFVFPSGPEDSYQRAVLSYQKEASATFGECMPFVDLVWENFKASEEGKPRDPAKLVCPS
jgi:hypothetical protein